MISVSWFLGAVWSFQLVFGFCRLLFNRYGVLQIHFTLFSKQCIQARTLGAFYFANYLTCLFWVDVKYYPTCPRRVRTVETFQLTTWSYDTTKWRNIHYGRAKISHSGSNLWVLFLQARMNTFLTGLCVHYCCLCVSVRAHRGSFHARGGQVK